MSAFKPIRKTFAVTFTVDVTTDDVAGVRRFIAESSKHDYADTWNAVYVAIARRDIKIVEKHKAKRKSC